MRFRTRLRSSSTLWAAPLILAIPVFYYLYGASRPEPPVFDYAPAIVSAPLYYSYALAYAVVSALSAWEGGRLKENGALQLAPARSRYRVAAGVLWLPVALGWLVLILPVGMALADYGVWPTELSLRPLWLAMAVCMAHAVIGFAVGAHMPKAIAAPVMAVTVWVGVSYTVTFNTMWPRHVSGGYFIDLMFGEGTSYGALAPHLLFTGSLALAVAIGWARLSRTVLRLGLALAVAVLGTSTARAMTSSWGANPPLMIDQAPLACSGKSPEVCVPKALDKTLRQARIGVDDVIADFRKAGVRLTPERVSDSITEGRDVGIRRSTSRAWYPPLSTAARADDLPYAVTREAVSPACRRPERVHVVAATLWATHITGTARQYQADLDRLNDDPRESALQEQANVLYEQAVRLPKDQQAHWYRNTLRAACGQLK